MISSSVVYGHPVTYSYEIPNEYLSGSMAIFLLPYVAIFSDSFFFGKATSSNFFRVNFLKVSQKLLFRNSSFFRAAAFFLRRSFFRTATFSQHISQNSYFFRAKLLPRNQTLRIGNSLLQLPFGTATHMRYLQKSYFFETDSSPQHQLFQKSKILEKATFSEKQDSALPTFSGELTFSCLFHKSVPSIAATTYLFRRVNISQVPFFSTAIYFL